ncbi:hypothetical protein [Flavobacteriaceae bacterium 14752]|uniref:hypothetical protein n=1 Tax=Mesohalobacter salilacus TaxID=2491711 RepID=UPI000F63CB1A|nr:hypothetical protein EIG84_09110 [Flavobacteriaceae bacterium 14752]
MKNKIAPLIPEHFYHIYNRANGNDILFKTKENYHFFLNKFNIHISPVANTFCYCLMPNHFHFLIQLKNEQEISDRFIDERREKKWRGQEVISGFVSQQFSNLFNAYTKAFNKRYNRKGSLFMRNFKRKDVLEESYLRKLVHYIHYNPIKAGLVKQPKDWEFSSYSSLTSERKTQLRRDETLSWFEDLANFKYCHQYPPSITGIEKFLKL